jgi:hypothetical protein
VTRNLRFLMAGTAALLYGLSLGLPAISVLRGTTSAGESAFELGWSAWTKWTPAELDWWIIAAAWLANPAIWIGILAVLLGRWRLGALAGACGLAFCLLPLTRFAQVVGVHVGYWAWVSSAAVVLATCASMASRGRPADSE